jgi:hypothetical protein
MKSLKRCGPENRSRLLKLEVILYTPSIQVLDDLDSVVCCTP